MPSRWVWTGTAATVVAAATIATSAQQWTTHGGDLGESRFSPLTQLTPANVGRLEKAWEFEAGASNLQLTPIVVGGQMYITAGSSAVVALPIGQVTRRRRHGCTAAPAIA
jgi:quinoprotein glucose dehydrogenase